MAISLNHNLAAANTARTLNTHYGNLAVSTQRLSSGLRINSAADDCAGLAIRELQRADIAALRQGIRNSNDAISLLQVADGALGIIDEKLIRMKELAEQAATGTYDSIQRLMIDSEFQAMAAEIDRIANATDFNGIHLLDGSLSGAHDGSSLTSTGKMKIHFGTANDSAEDYYYIGIEDCTTKGLGLHNKIIEPGVTEVPAGAHWIINDGYIDWDANKVFVDVPSRIAGAADNLQAIKGFDGFDYYSLPVGLENIKITSSNAMSSFFHKPHVTLFTKGGTQITGVNPDTDWAGQEGKFWWNFAANDSPPLGQRIVDKFAAAGILDKDAIYNGDNILSQAGENVQIAGTNIAIDAEMNERPGPEVILIDKITSDLVFTIGGHDNPTGGCNVYSLKIEADLTPELRAQLLGEDIPTEDTELINIATQQRAQEALTRITDAMVRKDKVRAHLGALQNRFENTISNLSIQAENLLASESRISDVDVAIEMTLFVRNQILTQSAVAMLSQANSMPQMAAQIIGG